MSLIFASVQRPNSKLVIKYRTPTIKIYINIIILCKNTKIIKNIISLNNLQEKGIFD